MRILLCNDDGIYARGIETLHDAISDLGDIIVVAPEVERSAVGHAITISSPLKSKKIYRNGSVFGHGVSGTPADCVKLAISQLLDQPPDLVLSGINLGPNAGISILYSGTVSGATEGAILGVPSMALSLATFTDPNWDTAATVARAMVQRVIEQPPPPSTVLNVNIPNRPVEQIAGVRTVRMAPSRYVEQFDERVDPRGNTYYWIKGHIEVNPDAPKENDVAAIDAGFVSLTPISFDLTDEPAMSELRSWETARF